MQRPGASRELGYSPSVCTRAYVFLASPQCSSYMTGEILPIIGGYGGG